MNQESSPSLGPSLLIFLAGAAIGAVVVALVTPKSGHGMRMEMKRLACRAKRSASDLANDADDAWSEVKDRSSLAAHDLKRGVTDAVDDLHGEHAEPATSKKKPG